MGLNDFLSLKTEQQHRTWRGNTLDLRSTEASINDLCLSERPPGAFLTKKNALAHLLQIARALNLTWVSGLPIPMTGYYHHSLYLAKKSVTNSRQGPSSCIEHSDHLWTPPNVFLNHFHWPSLSNAMGQKNAMCLVAWTFRTRLQVFKQNWQPMTMLNFT